MLAIGKYEDSPMIKTQAPGLHQQNALELAVVMLQHAEPCEQTARVDAGLRP